MERDGRVAYKVGGLDAETEGLRPADMGCDIVLVGVSVGVSVGSECVYV
jgi:hypothetical protein